MACTHGLTDDVDVTSVMSIEGQAGAKKVYTYYCREHDRHGVYEIEKPKPVRV